MIVTGEDDDDDNGGSTTGNEVNDYGEGVMGDDGDWRRRRQWRRHRVTQQSNLRRWQRRVATIVIGVQRRRWTMAMCDCLRRRRRWYGEAAARRLRELVEERMADGGW